MIGSKWVSFKLGSTEKKYYIFLIPHNESRFWSGRNPHTLLRSRLFAKSACGPHNMAQCFKKNGSRKLLDIDIQWLIAEDKYWEMLVPGPIWPMSDIKMWYKSWYKADDKCLKIEFPRVDWTIRHEEVVRSNIAIWQFDTRKLLDRTLPFEQFDTRKFYF